MILLLTEILSSRYLAPKHTPVSFIWCSTREAAPCSQGGRTAGWPALSRKWFCQCPAWHLPKGLSGANLDSKQFLLYELPLDHSPHGRNYCTVSALLLWYRCLSLPLGWQLMRVRAFSGPKSQRGWICFASPFKRNPESFSLRGRASGSALGWRGASLWGLFLLSGSCHQAPLPRGGC